MIVITDLNKGLGVSFEIAVVYEYAMAIGVCGDDKPDEIP
jgi:hypothetical protein